MDVRTTHSHGAQLDQHVGRLCDLRDRAYRVAPSRGDQSVGMISRRGVPHSFAHRATAQWLADLRRRNYTDNEQAAFVQRTRRLRSDFVWCVCSTISMLAFGGRHRLACSLAAQAASCLVIDGPRKARRIGVAERLSWTA